MRQIGIAVHLYAADYGERFPLCKNWGRAWGDAVALRRDNMWMPELLEPYCDRNLAKPTNYNVAKPRQPHRGLYTCPSGIRVREPDSVGWTKEFLMANDHVTYAWMHVYWRTNSQHELQKPVSGRVTTNVKEPSSAVIVWEMPYWNASRSAHPKGINLLYSDGHADFHRRNPKEYDWYFNRSRLGWD